MRDIWQVLKAYDPHRDWDKDPELNRALVEKLMDLADAGVTDAHEFCSRTLATFDLQSPALAVSD
jgi:hypothetical protein